MNKKDTSDPDKEEIDRLYPTLLKVDGSFEMESGLLAGKGICTRRKLTPRGGVLFTILFTNGTIKEWEWFD